MKSSASIFALGALAALGFSSANAVAQTADTVVFETIDNYALGSAGTGSAILSVTGLVQGATVATTEKFTIDGAGSTASCDRMLTVALNRPGRFLLTVERTMNLSSSARVCRLTRRP